MSYIERLNWADYAHSGATISMSAGVPEKFISDGLGTDTNTDFTHYPLWDSSTNEIDMSNMKVGDNIDIRLDMTITPDNNDTTIDIQLVSGLGFTLTKRIPLFKVMGVAIPFIEPLFFYVGSEAFRTASLEIYILADKDADLDISGIFLRNIRHS